MLRKIALWSVWAGFIAYVFLLSRPLHLSETIALLINILTFQWGEVNAIILSLFALVGVWLLIYNCLLFIDGRMQKIPFWVFALASVGSGVIGLIPYLALREPNQEFEGKKDSFLNLLDSRSTGIVLAVFTVFVVGYGVFAGNWADYIHQFQSDRFINGMSLAFCLFAVLFSTVLGDDMARRGWLKDSQLFWVIALVPLFGALLYLCIRPSLIESTS
ncbi:MAG: hypothetical protein KME01_04685 [Chroococcus sp. CMT-3BRIN-NPC107]|jgi:hypothetical protein|nr:hypothetical protein [Chroococcus sp. CMT-3BRIN-NPC107]